MALFIWSSRGIAGQPNVRVKVMANFLENQEHDIERLSRQSQPISEGSSCSRQTDTRGIKPNL